MTRVILALYRVRGVLYYPAAAVLILLGISSLLLRDVDAPIVRGALSVLAALALPAVVVAVLCILLSVLAPRLLPERERMTVSPPVRGRWLAVNSPATKVPSHGVRAWGQAYAIDLVSEPADGARPAFGEGPAMRPPADYPAFGAPVFAMIDGTVVRRVDGQRDHRSRSSMPAFVYMMIEGMLRELGGARFILGNHVVIRGDDGVCAVVAHLQRGSVAVGVGDRVRAGDVIARCGNSGNTSEPHVHAQLMDRASVWTGQGVPMAFAVAGSPTLPADGEHLVVAG